MYRRYILPLLLLLALSLGLRWLGVILSGHLGNALLIILRAVLLFSFGMSLNIAKRRRYESWLKKVIVSFVFIFFLVWDMGYVMIPELKQIFNWLGLYGYIVYLIYIYCGYIFFE